MNLLLIISILFGFSRKIFSQYPAPGTITIKISYRLDYSETPSKVMLKSKIKDLSDNILYDNLNRMRLIDNNEEVLETTISFNIGNVSEILIFTGDLIVPTKEVQKSESYKFSDQVFQFNLKHVNQQKAVPKTFYSSLLQRELNALLTTKCQRNFYPEHQCTALCIESENTKLCDSRGNKICNKGYYLNEELKVCNIDWCWNSAKKCQNNGKCLNKDSNFVCQCSSHYSGLYCERYRNLCETYICPNRTLCVMKKEKIVCEKNFEQEKISSSISAIQILSLHTLIVVTGFLILFVITVAITFWACKKTKDLKSRSVDNSIHSGQSYYPYNSSHKMSNSYINSAHSPHGCLCMNSSFYGNNAYYSLKHPNHQTLRSCQRAYSDLLIPTCNRKSSLSTLVINDEGMPLPPPVEYNDSQNGVIVL